MHESKPKTGTHHPEVNRRSIDGPGKQPLAVQLKKSVKGMSFAEGNAALSPDRFTVQRAGGAHQQADGIKSAAAHGVQGAGQQLPHLESIQRSFGQHDVNSVQAHVGGAAADASKSMGADAYTTGSHVAFKGSPDLHTAAHEAAHIVQQRAGVSLRGGVGQVGDRHEQHADAVANRVVAGKSAASLLDAYEPGGATATTAVQRKDEGPAGGKSSKPAGKKQGQGGSGTTGTGTTGTEQSLEAEPDSFAQVAAEQSVACRVASLGTVSGGVQYKRSSSSVRRANRSLVRDLLSGIDRSASHGLSVLEGLGPKDDVGEAADAARLAGRRIQQLLSVTALPGHAAASLNQFAGQAKLALGRCEQLANLLAKRAADASAFLRDMLESVEVEISPTARWKWRPIGLDVEKRAGKFTRAVGVNIGTNTMTMIEHRIDFVAKTDQPVAIVNTAIAVTDELRHAAREFASADDGPERLQPVIPQVQKLTKMVHSLEERAVALGVAGHSALVRMRHALATLRDVVGVKESSPKRLLETVAIMRQRVDAVSEANDAGAVSAAAVAVTSDLKLVTRELALLADPRLVQDKLADELFTLGQDLSILDETAFRVGIGNSPALAQMRAAETQLRAAVGLAERVPWEVALPTMQAIIDIVSGVARWVEDPSGNPTVAVKMQHGASAEIPSKYLSLLARWHVVRRTYVEDLDNGPKASAARGHWRLARLQDAVLRTQPLVNTILNQSGTPEDTAAWLDKYFDGIDKIRARASAETVGGSIEVAADTALAAKQSPVELMDSDMQIKVATLRIDEVSKNATKFAQRLASTNKSMLKVALAEAQKNSTGVDFIDKQLQSATTVADALRHISSLASATKTIVDLTDPEKRRKLFKVSFSSWKGVTNDVALAKALLTLTRGLASATGLVTAGLVKASGHSSKAAELLGLANMTKVANKLSTALNVLGVAHGLLTMLTADTTAEKVDGAVEMVYSGLGLGAKFVPSIAEWAGPLGVGIAITWESFKAVGDAAMGMMYDMIGWQLREILRDMRRHALDIHRETMLLAVALGSKDKFGAEHAQTLREKTRAYRDAIRRDIRRYLKRTQAPGRRNKDPGNFDVIRDRFAPLVGAKLAPDDQLFMTVDRFLATVVGCIADWKTLLDAAVDESFEKHG